MRAPDRFSPGLREQRFADFGPGQVVSSHVDGSTLRVLRIGFVAAPNVKLDFGPCSPETMKTL